MINFRNASIRVKVLVALLGCGIASLLLISLLLSINELASLRTQKERSIKVSAHLIAERSNAALLFGDQDMLRDNLASLGLDPSILIACAYGEGGVAMANFQRRTDLVCPEHIPEVASAYSGDYLHISEPMLLDGKEIGRLYVRSDLTELRQRFTSFLKVILISAGAIGFVILLVAIQVAHVITAPILELNAAALSIARERKTHIRVARRSQDEIGELVESFNYMVATVEANESALQENHARLEQIVDERTRELSNANQELEAFSYSVSHDLRAPLRTIDGFSVALLEDCADRLDENDMSNLRRIRAGAQRMGILIESLLDLSRVTRRAIQYELVDLSALAREVSEELMRGYGSRQIEWRIAEGIIAFGDRQLLRVMFDNLLGNAGKYSGKVEHARIEFGRIQNQGKDAFFISDNGAGFDMQYAGRLFGAFQRLHRVDEFEGTGIGLATVQRVVARHHGEIWAEAAPGQGATFYFTLPRPMPEE